MKTSRAAFASIIVLPALAAAAACANTAGMSIGKDCQDGFCNGDPPTFTSSPDSGGDEQTPDPDHVLACIGTECPAPWASCSPTTPCGTNLENDVENCGACGVSCVGMTGLHIAGACMDGVCVFQCTTLLGYGDPILFRDCNGLLDDGCEVSVQSDTNNCGVCGHACAPGEHCNNGFCGCIPPKVDCNGTCTDTNSDDVNCKTCGTVCSDPTALCAPMPLHTIYGCMSGECGQLKCTHGLFEPEFDDCNGDLPNGCESDGCEAPLNTVENCGGCGIKCGPQQGCRKMVDGRTLCMDTCKKRGLADCTPDWDKEYLFVCSDLLSDPSNCGSCGVQCVGQRDNQIPVCDKGLCSTACLPGFADCNGEAVDGCEVDLNSNPANCGVCGHTCDLSAGQPCIEGKCLLVECDAGVITK